MLRAQGGDEHVDLVLADEAGLVAFGQLAVAGERVHLVAVAGGGVLQSLPRT